MPELAAIVTLRAAAGQEEALASALRKLAAASQREDGCLRYDLYRAEEESWVVVEGWRDRAAFDAHVAEPHTAEATDAFNRLLAAPPSIVPCTAENVK